MERAHEGWEHIPLVKLGMLLKQMIWFSGECLLDAEKEECERFRRIPKRAWFNTMHRGKEISILCTWQEPADPAYFDSSKYRYSNSSRFAIGVEMPYHYSFRISRRNVPDRVKFFYTKFYSIAVDKIEDLLYDAREVLDERIEEEEQKQRQNARVEALRRNLCESLGVSLKRCGQILTYRPDNKYCLRFVPSDSGDEFFEITNFGGRYTEAEIRKIIEIVGGNPRAVVERLSR
ncbi:MAG: hypothetical protein ACE5HW_01525 [Candidatus Methanofastidiosia archaeon]